MYIQKIKLENFRNYKKAEIKFDKNINIIYGDNAQGKTNILESIFVCSLGKSFRTNKDKELINKEKDFSKIEMISQKKDRDINVKFEMKEKKKFYIMQNSWMKKEWSTLWKEIFPSLIVKQEKCISHLLEQESVSLTKIRLLL